MNDNMDLRDASTKNADCYICAFRQKNTQNMVLREIVLVGSFFDLLIKGCSFLQVPLLNAVHHFDPFFSHCCAIFITKGVSLLVFLGIRL